MYLCAPMRGPARQIDRVVAFADYHAVCSRPAVARLGWFHGDAELGDPDAIAFFHPVNDLREQWTGLIAQLLFGRCDAAELVAVAEAGKQLPRFAITAKIKVQTAVKHGAVESQNIAAIWPRS